MVVSKDKQLSTAASDLRRHAEEQLHGKKAERHYPRTNEETQRIVHELEVHQIELEMQNAELRQAREELEKVLGKCTDLYDFAPISYFTLDREGVISAVNLAGASLLAVQRSLLIGRSFELFVAATEHAAFNDFLNTVLTSSIKNSCEVALLNERNQTVIVLVEAMATASGQEFRLNLIDITERRRAEDTLAVKRQELIELNGSLEVRIVQAVEELRQKDQMLILKDRQAVVGEMVNNIAHQWLQPLNTLGLVIQKLPLFYDTAEFNREFLEEYTGTSMELVRHMSRTVNDFNDFFRPDKKKHTFNINQVIARTLSLIGQSFQDQHISIAFDPEAGPMADGYPNEYAQVLLNILMNARDALVEHHVDGALISMHAFTDRGKSVVIISDNGGGIAEEIIDKLFEPYFTTKGPDKGTGIGLFMSKIIIERNMGGRLTVRNCGKGAEFRIEV